MKFYGNGLVWNKDENKVLCSFVNGKYETEDSIIINKLKELNFVFDDIDSIKIENKNDVDYESLEYKDLKKVAKEKGINTYKMDKPEIIKALNELMKVGE